MTQWHLKRFNSALIYKTAIGERELPELQWKQSIIKSQMW